jgi:acetoacetate decarboxylase
MISNHPERTLYREAAIGVKCRFGERQGVFYPVMWVSTEWALLRGLLNGYQKRLADAISLSKIHPLNPGLKPLGPGTALGGFCVKGSERTLGVRVTLKHKSEPSDLPAFGAVFGRRAFPRTDASQREVMEAVEILKSNQKTTNVWLGDGSFESSIDLGETKPTLGAVYSSGFTIGGSRVLSRDRNV